MTIKEVIQRHKTIRNLTIDKIVTIKQYVNMKTKRELINNVLNNVITYDEYGVAHVNECDKYIEYVLQFLMCYTNIECGNDKIEDYDALCESGVLQCLMEFLNDEFESVLALLNMQQDYIMDTHNVEYLILKRLSNLCIGGEKNGAKIND